MNFSTRLDDMMFEAKLTPIAFSKTLGVDVSIVYRYLKGKCNPSLTNALKIADLFGCSLDYLFGVSNDPSVVSGKSAESFASRFRKVLKEHDCTRYKLKKNTDFAHQSLADWYYGRKEPTIENLMLLAKHFDCTMDYISGRV